MNDRVSRFLLSYAWAVVLIGSSVAGADPGGQVDPLRWAGSQGWVEDQVALLGASDGLLRVAYASSGEEEAESVGWHRLGKDLHGGLHFSHPLIAESPSPDTKARLDYFIADDSGQDTHTVVLELEYAFARWISVEIGLPYIVVDPRDGAAASNLGNIELGLKLASFHFEKIGLLISGGIELGLPTGDDNKGIGSNNELEVEPFVGVGLKKENWEIIGFLAFGIPVNESEDEKDEVDLEIGYNVSLLYHVSSQVMVLFELDGEAVASGDDNEAALNLVPGLKIRPWADSSLEIGVGVRLPVTEDKAFDAQGVFSIFYHY